MTLSHSRFVTNIGVIVEREFYFSLMDSFLRGKLSAEKLSTQFYQKYEKDTTKAYTGPEIERLEFDYRHIGPGIFANASSFFANINKACVNFTGDDGLVADAKLNEVELKELVVHNMQRLFECKLDKNRKGD